MGQRTRFNGSGWLQTLKRAGDATAGLHTRDESDVVIGDNPMEMPKFADEGARLQITAANRMDKGGSE